MNKVGAVITAGGCGTFGEGIPKLLHPLPTGRSIIHEVIHRVEAARITTVVVTENNYRFRRMVRDHLEQNGVGHVVFAHQNERSGAAKAVEAGLRRLPAEISSVLVVYGDMPLWLPETIARLVRLKQRGLADVAMVSLQLQERTPAAFKAFGRVVRRNGRVIAIYEPGDEVPKEALDGADSVSPSLFVFGRSWLEKHLPLIEPVDRRDGWPAEYYLPRVLATDPRVSVAELLLPPERWDEARGINSWQEYELACQILRERQ